MRAIRFTTEDLELFQSASHDGNPLHTSEDYARRTAYGGRVVYGILNAIIALGHAAVLERPGWVLSSIECDFFDVASLETEYSVTSTEESPSEVGLRVSDGRRPVLDLFLTFRSGTSRTLQPSPGKIAVSADAQDFQIADLRVGQRVSGTYSVCRRNMEAICARAGLNPCWAIAPEMSALLWASYLIGMELPGKRALFSRLRLDFPTDTPVLTPFEYEAEIERISDSGEVSVRADLMSQDQLWAKATINSYVRQEVPIPSIQKIEELVGYSELLLGKVAFVTGASRGLGACIVRALALHGCTVLMNFRNSQPEAEQVRDSVAHTSGKAVLEKGDASDIAWCLGVEERIAKTHKGVDLLICNASPALLPLWLEPTAAVRVNEFLAKSLALVSAPTAAFMPLVAQCKGWHVLISSTAVRHIHPHFPHYAAAKAAAETLVHAAIAEYRTVSGLIVRPARLLTDLTNTPLGRKGALPPETVAVSLVKRLLGQPIPGKVEVLDQFSSGSGS